MSGIKESDVFCDDITQKEKRPVTEYDFFCGDGAVNACLNGESAVYCGDEMLLSSLIA